MGSEMCIRDSIRWALPAARFSAPCLMSWKRASSVMAWPRSVSVAAWVSPPSSKGSELIRWDRTDDGIVILTLDDPEQNTNTMNARYVQAMTSTVDRLEAERDSITGVVVTSAKDGFLAGADLKSLTAAMAAPADSGGGVQAAAFAITEQMKSYFRRIERLGRPVPPWRRSGS